MQPIPWVNSLPSQISSDGHICLFFPINVRIISSASVLIQPKYNSYQEKKQAIFKHLTMELRLKYGNQKYKHVLEENTRALL